MSSISSYFKHISLNNETLSDKLASGIYADLVYNIVAFCKNMLIAGRGNVPRFSSVVIDGPFLRLLFASLSDSMYHFPGLNIPYAGHYTDGPLEPDS